MEEFFKEACLACVSSIFKNESELENWKLHFRALKFFRNMLPNVHIEKRDLHIYIALLKAVLQGQITQETDILALPLSVKVNFVKSFETRLELAGPDSDLTGLLEGTGIMQIEHQKMGEFEVRIRWENIKWKPGL